VAPDYAQAYQYNARALHSLDALQASNTPEAQTLLRGLPVEPSQLKLQLQDTLQRLQQAH